LDAALAEDPMAFEYDGVYREMKKEEIARKAANQDTGPKKVFLWCEIIEINLFYCT
jgi:hypothetical protein